MKYKWKHNLRYGVGVNIVRFQSFNWWSGQPRVRFPVSEMWYSIFFAYFSLLSFPPDISKDSDHELSYCGHLGRSFDALLDDLREGIDKERLARQHSFVLPPYIGRPLSATELFVLMYLWMPILLTLLEALRLIECLLLDCRLFPDSMISYGLRLYVLYAFWLLFLSRAVRND